VLAFALGLPAFAMTKVFQPGFYAREDTATPMRFAIVSVAVNIVASLVLSRFFAQVGIAMGTSIAAWINAGLLGITLSRRGFYTADERLQMRLPRIILSGLVMGALLLLATRLLSGSYAPGAGFTSALWALLILVAGGIASYFVAAHVTGAMRFAEFRSMLKR
jgi:putative peptidoglycan lipid II flippase